MARVLVNDESLYGIANAIRGKLDVETTFLPSQMASAIDSIETGTSLTSEDEGKVVVESGGDYVLQAQTSRNISSNGTYDTTTNDEVVVAVSGGANLGAKTITVNGTYDPSDDGLDGYDEVIVSVADGGQSDLLALALGNESGPYVDGVTTKLGAYAFYGKEITAVDMSLCATVGISAFAYCANLRTVSLPTCESVGSSAFYSCHSLSSLYIPECVSLGNVAFAACPSLESVDLPLCTVLPYFAFGSCTSIVSASLPMVEEVGSSAFTGCSALPVVSLPAARVIGGYAFYNCRSLMSVYLLGSSVVSLASHTAFQSTPMLRSNYTGAFGSIFVPSSLYDAYVSAPNWVSYSARIASYTEA